MLPRLTIKNALLASFLNIGLYAADQFTPLVPPKAQPYLTMAQLLAQMLLGTAAHYSNPDGTPAATPYDPKAAAPTKP